MNSTTSINGKVRESDIVRVNGKQTFVLPFGLGVAFQQHWTDGRTTIHPFGDCIHCANKMIEIRDVTAHVGYSIRNSKAYRSIIILPASASQCLIDQCQRPELTSTALRVVLTRASSSKRSSIECSVTQYPNNSNNPKDKVSVTTALMEVLFERLYRKDEDPDWIKIENSFTRLI